jgi:hypothetical protein
VNRTRSIIALAALAAFLPAPGMAQSRTQQGAANAGSGTSGTPGRIARFTTSKNLGDSVITQSDAGNVGVGTTAPTSPLTVNGVVETTGAGGVKFPDGSVQTTAGLPVVSHDATLQGDGTPAAPLGLAFPLRLRFTFSGSVLEINNPGQFGDGINVVAGPGTNDNAGGTGVISQGGGGPTVGGYGVQAGGGSAFNGVGGDGVRGFGGSVSRGIGGYGVQGFGGAGIGTSDGFGATGGFGVRAVGGSSSGAGRRGGTGIEAVGGSGLNGAGPGRAGTFRGDVEVLGTLSKAGGSFKIDHPTDPENKTLSHSFVESPDMKNIYDGVAQLDASGEAVVELPEWFGALNRDYRYLLTPMGGSMPGLYLAEEISNNRFKIAGGAAGLKVSWQVTGIRQDAWANKHRIPLEEDKPEAERGHYLHPEAFDKPEERGVDWAYEPEAMRRDKETREAAQRRPSQSPE